VRFERGEALAERHQPGTRQAHIGTPARDREGVIVAILTLQLLEPIVQTLGLFPELAAAPAELASASCSGPFAELQPARR
jgi:hypothetical protein